MGAASDDTGLRNDQYRRHELVIEAVLLQPGQQDSVADSFLHRGQ
jgi:hypothetical protein